MNPLDRRGLLLLGPATYGPLGETSHVASIRLRVLPLINAGIKLGLKIFSPNSLEEAWQLLVDGQVDFVYVGKWRPPSDKEATGLIIDFLDSFVNEIVPRRQLQIIYDFCENSLLSPHPWHRNYSYFWLSHADIAIASSEALACEVLLPRICATCKIHVVSDCLEQLDPSMAQNPLRGGLAWFGHPSNFDSLVDAAVKHRPTNLTMTVITNAARVKEQMFASEGLLRFESCFNAVHWHEYLTPSELAIQMQEVGSVLIPVDMNNERKLYSSHNRLTTSLLLGKQVFASPIPSYTSFAGSVVLSDDPLGAFLNGEKPSQPVDHDLTVQHLKRLFSSEVIEAQYASVLTSLLS